MPVQPSTTALLEFLELAESAYTPEDRARERRQRNRARAHGTASPTEENHEEDLQWIIRNMDYNRRWDYTRPTLTHAQWEVCESYGGWTRFVDYYGLKRPWSLIQKREGIHILDTLARRIADRDPDSPYRD